MPGTDNARPQPLNTQEVAAELRLHPDSVRQMLERGALPGAKIGNRWYIRREDLDKVLAGEPW